MKTGSVRPRTVAGRVGSISSVDRFALLLSPICRFLLQYSERGVG